MALARDRPASPDHQRSAAPAAVRQHACRHGHDVRNFGGRLTHTDGLYFAVTVFSTVGFGDITAKTEAARLVVTGQKIGDIVILGFAVKIILGAPSRRRQPGDADGAQPPSTSAASSRGRCPGIPPRSHPADDFTKFVTVSQERGSTDPAIPAETPRSSPRSARHSSTVRVRPRHTRPDVHPRTTRTDAGLTQRAETGSVSFLHHQLRLRAASQVTLLRTRPVDAELSPLTVWAARDTARLYPSGTAAGGGSD